MTGWRWGWLIAAIVNGLFCVVVLGGRFSRHDLSRLWAIGFGVFAGLFAWMFIADVTSPYSVRAMLFAVMAVPLLLRELYTWCRDAFQPASSTEAEAEAVGDAARCSGEDH